MYIKRKLEEKIREFISTKEILAIIGPRQVGKTTLIKHILEDYKNTNIVTFDDFEIQNIFKNDIQSFIELYIKGYDYIFIDEIQYAENSGQQLKYIYDTTEIKILISGSSSTEISIQSLKYLVGRIFVFKLFPFSFSEFLLSKNKKLQILYLSKNYGEEINRQLNNYLQEFITYGGYPRVVLSETNEKKEIVLKNIINILILREVKDLFGIAKTDELILLIKALSLQIGNLINYNELGNQSGLNYKQLKKYFQILEELMICKRCSAFSKNSRTELTKVPKIYFIDYGLRNAIINNYSVERTDKGALYKNLIYSEFLKKDVELKYWRTKSGAEVDFIYMGEPIEIKTTPKTSRSFYSFIKKYSPQNGFIISEFEKERILSNGTEIIFLPFSKFI